MAANVASRLPHFCVYGKANEHDSKKEEILFESLNAGDIGILDRAYNCFETLYKQSLRGVIFVVREKETMLHEVIESIAKWSALLTHLVMKYLKFKSRAVCSYSRFVAFICAIVWLKKDLMNCLGFYGIAMVLWVPLPILAHLALAKKYKISYCHFSITHPTNGHCHNTGHTENI